jgi:uncharacterized protein (DUF2267 family)
MTFKEMIKEVQLKSGFSDAESKDALQTTVESVAVRLTEGERKDFASQLPEELKDIAMSVYPTEQNSRSDILAQFADMQDVEKDRAKKQLLSSWQVLKSALTKGQIEHVRTQLPKQTVEVLG